MKKIKFFSLFFLVLFYSLFLVCSLEKEKYSINLDVIDRKIKTNELFTDFIEIENKGSKNLIFSISSNIDEELLEVNSSSFNLEPYKKIKIPLFFKGAYEGIFSGEISIYGDINEKIKVNLSVVNSSENNLFLVDLILQKDSFSLFSPIEFKVDFSLLKPIDKKFLVKSTYFLVSNESSRFILGEDYFNVSSSFQVIKNFSLPEGLTEGFYSLEAEFIEIEKEYKVVTKNSLYLFTPFFQKKIFGIAKISVILVFIGFCILSFLVYFSIKRYLEKKKKYKMLLDKKTLPKKGANNFYLGKIAETNLDTFFEPNKLTTHCIVAGATGGGKSISAQVIVEEALMKNIAVIVFDPTAQWSGMLRKCEDKRMLALYPNFGLKKTDARAFPGNVRQILDARQVIDINKYINPGQIQIFTLNRLEPQDIDIFVANVIRQIFRSNPKESPDLKVLLVFDEVHRLLPKFGGSGEGFLQIERACREFRKWGFGLILISQVLSDFVGEIKANINTEIQMRTRDEGDLNRISIKYGEDFLKSLIKSSVGVGMIVNPSYNHGRPYFVQFRPILHNTRRLSDEELEKYNKYNEIIDDLEYQIEQLEKEKIDVFDLKMELKLVKNKLMSGSFSVVDIYLEGLKPRVEKYWEKLGKKPEKRKIELVNIEEIKKSVEEAKKEREKILQEEKKKEENKPKEDIETKQLKPLTFDNGLMVSTLKELLDVLPNLDEEIFVSHVNENKNDVANFLSQIFPQEYEELKKLTKKEELIKRIKEILEKQKKN
ncbi:MAG: DUF87 domain-containing protein [Candidatus Pacearchaeota archaeon]